MNRTEEFKIKTAIRMHRIRTTRQLLLLIQAPDCFVRNIRGIMAKLILKKEIHLKC